MNRRAVVHQYGFNRDEQTDWRGDASLCDRRRDHRTGALALAAGARIRRKFTLLCGAELGPLSRLRSANARLRQALPHTSRAASATTRSLLISPSTDTFFPRSPPPTPPS